MSPLQAAARELLAGASETTLRGVLKLLLDDKPRTERTARPIRPVRTIRRTRKRRAAAPATPPDPTWETLRKSVRETMRSRGVDFSGLAKTVGIVPASLRNVIYRCPPPSARVRTALKAWLDSNRPEVVTTPPAPFRSPAPAGNGAAAPAASEARA
jgi:hypothetical protein